MKLNSHNEWDTLKEVIIGMPNARANLIFKKQLPKKVIEQAKKLAHEAYPKYMINDLTEDINGLCDILKDYGVKIYRPKIKDVHNFFSTPYFNASTEHVFNPRDIFLIIGNTIIETPSYEKHRYFEAQAYYNILYKYFSQGCKWISAPKPMLRDGEKVTKKNKKECLKEKEIMFEAATVVRMGKSLLYLLSPSGNMLGAKWLQSILGKKYKIHITDKIYNGKHIDSTVICLNKKQVLLNAQRVNKNNCPIIFNKWDKIWLNKISPYPKEIIDFHKKIRLKTYNKLQKLGINSNLNNIHSEWVGINILSIDPETVIVEKNQKYLIKKLEKRGLNCIPTQLRYSYFMGGLHCCSLDTVRKNTY